MLLISVLFIAGSIIAQENAKKVKPVKPIASGKPTIEQRAQKAVDKLNNVVALTEDQKTKIYTLSIDREKKLEEIKGKYKGPDGKIDKEAAKEDFKAANREYRKAVKEILTPEQIQILKEKAKEKKEKEKAEKEKQGAGVEKEKVVKENKEIKANKEENEIEEIIPVE